MGENALCEMDSSHHAKDGFAHSSYSCCHLQTHHRLRDHMLPLHREAPFKPAKCCDAAAFASLHCPETPKLGAAKPLLANPPREKPNIPSPQLRPMSPLLRGDSFKKTITSDILFYFDHEVAEPSPLSLCSLGDGARRVDPAHGKPSHLANCEPLRPDSLRYKSLTLKLPHESAKPHDHRPSPLDPVRHEECASPRPQTPRACTPGVSPKLSGPLCLSPIPNKVSPRPSPRLTLGKSMFHDGDLDFPEEDFHLEPHHEIAPGVVYRALERVERTKSSLDSIPESEDEGDW